VLSSRVDEIAATILEHSPPLTGDGRRVALATYRLLANGAPVQVGWIAERARLDSSRVEALLDSWPGVFRDDAQQVVGYWGLSIVELGQHRLHIDGVRLSAWCAWDTLFLPTLIGQPADVESRSPLDRKPVSLRVRPDGIESRSPTNLVVSMLPARNSDDFIRTFCHQIHFFASTAEGERWTAEREGVFLMPLADASELAVRVNEARFGDALAAAT